MASKLAHNHSEPTDTNFKFKKSIIFPMELDNAATLIFHISYQKRSIHIREKNSQHSES